jgi:hypothetical protein
MVHSSITKTQLSVAFHRPAIPAVEEKGAAR